MRRFVLLAALAALAALSPSALSSQPAPFAGLDAYIERAIVDWEIPGFALAIVRNDSIIHVRGYGVRKIGEPARVDERTMFAAASTTKAFTAALIAMLVDEKKMRWDDPATRHLPGFQLYDPYATRELTIRDLLSHRSGLSRGDFTWYATTLDRDEVVRRVRFLRPTWSFRSSYGYQNVMFVAAGEAIESASGREWDDLIDERLFTPLGMAETVTSIEPLAAMTNVAQPHARVDGRTAPVAWRNVDNIGAAGSMNSNVREMAEWVRLQLGNGVYNGRRLISAAAMREMHSPHTIVPLDTVFNRVAPEIHFRSYGLGWFLEDYRGRKVIWHNGNLDGMSSIVGLMPEENLGLVILTNMNNVALNSAIMRRVWDHQLATPSKDWSAVLLRLRRDLIAREDSTERRRQADRVRGTRPSLPLAAYAGSYTDSLAGPFRIVLRDNRLIADAGPAFGGELQHWHFDTFRINWGDPMLGRSFVTFTIGPSGKIEGIRVQDWSDFRRDADPAPNR